MTALTQTPTHTSEESPGSPEDLFEHRHRNGLTASEAEARRERFGKNDVEERDAGRIRAFLAPLYSPISLMLLGAAFLSFVNHRIFDAYFIVFLYIVNYSMQKWQEFKADKAIQELRSKLSFEVSTHRDNRWVFVNAVDLVPGDHIRMGLGSIIPADGTVFSAKNCSVNESVLTGESMPKEKNCGDSVFSGSFVSMGNLEAEITATGKHTVFGKTIFSIESSAEQSILEKDILHITRLLMSISIASVFILTLVFIVNGFPIDDLLLLDLGLIIAGIPIALPAVMAIILSIGASGLAKKQVVVRRLSALQDLANVNLLLTDKTGTLTRNEIRVANVISYQNGVSTDDVVELAHLATSTETPDALDQAITKRYGDTGRPTGDFEVLNFIPYDSDRKRSTALIRKDRKEFLISLGAPQVIRALDDFASKEMAERFERDIVEAADQGYRSIAVATKKDGAEEKHMEISGLLLLADPLDEHSKETLHFMKANGIDVKMLTGDNQIIAGRIARELDLPGKVLTAEKTRTLYQNKNADAMRKEIDSVSVFAEILPKDKYEIVRAMKSRHIVAATGDGINDLPALRVAHVGIAVSGAVSALKSMADIVLLGQGIAVIRDAILESRKIFVRLYNYSIYRISESFRLIVTILILGVWYGFYPLVPLQILLLAFLNDIPIISLAFDRVKITGKPSEIHAKERLWLSVLFGSVGVLNSVLLFFFMTKVLDLSLPVIQTIFFLKLTVSGHALIFVAHTKERWYRFLPSKAVMIATISTQIIATLLATTGFLMPAKISVSTAILVWVWALFWMQVSEFMKIIQEKALQLLPRYQKKFAFLRARQ